MNELEEMGYLFKGDPTFDYVFNKLPRGYLMHIISRRRERMEKQGPKLTDIL